MFHCYVLVATELIHMPIRKERKGKELSLSNLWHQVFITRDQYSKEIETGLVALVIGHANGVEKKAFGTTHRDLGFIVTLLD